MNMSDDIASATLQVSTKVAEAGTHAFEKQIDIIAKLLQLLGNRNKDGSKGGGKLESTDLTDLKPGEVGIKELMSSAKKNGDTISVSDNGFTKEDMKLIKKKAKEMGIPVAFTGKDGKDNIYANVRTSDLPIFQRICTDVMKDKVAANPQQLGNFKVQEWEMPFITAELNKHDLSASFGQTESGEHFCLFDKADEKAILIARSDFVRKCSEVEKEMSFDSDENGNLTIKDLRTGKEISFDSSMSRDELSALIQEEFGYDENKAKIACAKFGEDMLSGEEKQKFFSSNPQNEFSKIDTNIKVEGESILTQDYSCWRLTPKSDKVPKIVFRDDDGNFAVLDPNKMSRKEMAKVLENQLHITDEQTKNALIDKAERVHDYYSKQNTANMSASYTFDKSDFDMSDPDVTKGMLRTDENGKTFTKQTPISDMNSRIERDNKKEFTVTSTVRTVETDEAGEHYTSSDTRTLHLSFSDKKNALKQLTELYKEQGVPDHIAKQMAKETYAKAQAQSAEKVLHIEEVKEDKIIVGYGGKTAEIDITDRDKAIEQIGKTFGVSDEEAEIVLDKAIEKAEQAKQTNADDKTESKEKSKSDEEKDEEKKAEKENDSDDKKEESDEERKEEKKDNSKKEKLDEKNGHERHKQEDGAEHTHEKGGKDKKPDFNNSSGGRRRK